MNIKFMLNEYVLIWILLFKESISKELNSKKQKIWFNYEKEYNKLFSEKVALLSDPKNYIPNDDRIYNIMKDEDVYKNILNNTDKYKLIMRKIWNIYKKNINKELDNIIRIPISEYEAYLIDPRLNMADSYGDEKNIVFGMVKESDQDTIINLVYNIIKKEVLSNTEKSNISKSVIELCELNELATRVNGISCYRDGNRNLTLIKRRIYPYFLMYLGVKKEEFKEYMKRDGIVFDTNNYEYDKSLSKMNVYEFIDYCTEIQKTKKELENIELI